MPQIKNKNALTIAILIPLATGVFSALLSNNMSSYTTLNKPPFSPPSFIFPIVWSLLFIFMGISSYIIYNSDNKNKNKSLTIYGIQLFFNFCWSIIFFRFSQYLLAFVWLIILIMLILIMIRNFYKINPVSAYLQIPYLFWCIFASYLNFAIFLLNS